MSAEVLRKVAEVLDVVARKTALLSAIGWSQDVEREFFARGAKEMPRVTYSVDRDGAEKRVAELSALEQSITGQEPLPRWLRATVHSFIDGNRLLLAIGTPEFHKISRELYGAARSDFHGSRRTNLDLAVHVLERLQSGIEADEAPLLDAETFAARLRAKLAARQPHMDIEVVVDERLIARVQAGMSRVRIRTDAKFTEDDVDNLWSHEIETHALSAHNGARQVHAPFLRSGGPRSTRTQEGLATFAELFDHDLSITRMRQLAERVQMVDMAEQGANFLELYGYALSRGKSPRESFLDAQRICRGGLLEGGAPFTKDVCYLSGLMEVYAFLSAAVRGGRRSLAELLVAGRIALEDVPTLNALREEGWLSAPIFLPRWLQHWNGLLPYFALTSFLTEFNLDEVAARFGV